MKVHDRMCLIGFPSNYLGPSFALGPFFFECLVVFVAFSVACRRRFLNNEKPPLGAVLRLSDLSTNSFSRMVLLSHDCRL